MHSISMPELVRRDISGISLLTDESLFESIRVRIAFTMRHGGCSEEPYESLNLGLHVGDDPAKVQRNRRLALMAAGAWEGVSLICPNQVHGSHLEVVESSDAGHVEEVKQRAAEGCDGIVVDCKDVAAMLCFADCLPVIIVAPSGAFAVVHAGWRGVVSRIAGKAVRAVSGLHGEDPSGFNVYIGSYIHGECFEVSDELADRFREEFDDGAVCSTRHVDLGFAIRQTLEDSGVDALRIADAGQCTVCANNDFFSYRAEDGVCGRHGAFAFRR